MLSQLILKLIEIFKDRLFCLKAGIAHLLFSLISMFNGLHFITGAADTGSDAGVSTGSAGNGFENGTTFIFIALEARTQTAIGIVVGLCFQTFL
jgi:hypothetical protein